jgi:cytochrome c oxidase assembly protein subunit 15
MRARGTVGLHRSAMALAFGIVLLVAAGGLVKSREAGLSVPDWPLSYGGLNPPGWWRIANVRAEHGHRLFAGAIAVATVALALLAQRREPRRAVRRLAWAAVAAVLLQAALGGMTVLLFLPPAVSIAHAALAELFLGLMVTVAVVTGPGWSGTSTAPPSGVPPRRLGPLAASLPAVVFLQILLGAGVRHLGAGLAIPDFPLVFGGVLPPRWSPPIALHFAHRLGALAVVALTIALALALRRHAPGEARLAAPARVLVALVGVQVLLGGAVVWSARAVVPNTAHVAVGASVLAASLVLGLEVWRDDLARRLAGAPRAPAASTAAGRLPALSR